MGLTVQDLKGTYDRWWLGVAKATDTVVGWFDDTHWTTNPDGTREKRGDYYCPLCHSTGAIPCPVPHKHVRPNARDDDGRAYFDCPVCEDETAAYYNNTQGTITCGYCGGGDGALAAGPLITADGVEVSAEVDEDPSHTPQNGWYTPPDGWYPFPPHDPEPALVRKWKKGKWVGKARDAYDLVDEYNGRRRPNAYDPDDPPPPEWDLDGDETPYKENSNEYAAVGAGWYRDPEDPDLARWWSGTMWLGQGVDPAHIIDRDTYT